MAAGYTVEKDLKNLDLTLMELVISYLISSPNPVAHIHLSLALIFP
jgi:hypothetical protein